MKTIQINRCVQEDLEWLPGVGPATAKKVIEARPVKDIGELQQLIPPSAWLKVQEAGVEFEFGDGQEKDEESRRKELLDILVSQEKELSKVEVDELQELLAKAPPSTGLDLSYQPSSEPPMTLLQEPQPLTLRRVMPGQELKPKTSYLCIWNMQWGPGGEAFQPADAPTQAEIGAWFEAHHMDIQFAHYGASVRVRTRNRGLVPLVLFEIIEETENDSEGDEKGD